MPDPDIIALPFPVKHAFQREFVEQLTAAVGAAEEQARVGGSVDYVALEERIASLREDMIRAALEHLKNR